MKKLAKFLADNSLSLMFLVLFAICIVGQALTGQRLENDTRALHGQAPLEVWQVVATGQFLQGVFSNWQAAILQLGALIVFGTFLHQRGAPHSKKLGAERLASLAKGAGSTVNSAGEVEETGSGNEGPQVTGESWLHRHSLAAVFFALFVMVFALHVVSGAAAYNVQLAYDGRPQLTLGAYFASAEFWFTTLQTWEAEMMAMALYVLLSVFLREEGSPESKPTDASNEDTGDPNQ